MLPLLGNGMVSVAENLGAPSGVAALLIAVAPLMIVVFRFAEGDRPRPLSRARRAARLRRAGGAGAGRRRRGRRVPGRAGAAGDVRVDLLGVRVLRAAAAVAAARRVRRPTVYEMLFGGLLLLTVGRLSGESFTAAAYGPRTWSALGYLVVFGSVVAFTSYVWLLANAPISFVATYAYVNPVVAVFLGWLVLDERVTWAVVAGGGIVVSAVALVISAERPRRRTRAVADGPVPAAVAGEPGPVDEVCADDPRADPSPAPLRGPGRLPALATVGP